MNNKPQIFKKNIESITKNLEFDNKTSQNFQWT